MSMIQADVGLNSQHSQSQVENEPIDEPLSPQQLRFQTYKDLLILCAAFLFQFTAFVGIENLQSSINTDDNVGVNSLMIIYVAFILSALFLPHFFIFLFGLKWTLVISQVPYLLYVAANYYPKAYLMYPAAGLVGLAAAPLWTAQASYLTKISTLYAQTLREDNNIIINRFFGIFFMCFQSSEVWGDLISYLVIQPKGNAGRNQITNNVSSKYEKCGASFGKQDYLSSESIDEIDRTTIGILCFVYICLCVCSILIIILFLSQIHRESKDKMSTILRHSVKLLLSTVKHMRQINQLLLIPLTMWAGIQQSFLAVQFTRAFVSCSFNAKYVGLVFIIYGVSDSISSLVFGQIVKIIGRWPCFLIGALINYSLITIMFVWRPTENQMIVLFILAGLWGVADGIWITLINAFCGVIFDDSNEAAFSNYRLWESSGYLLIVAITPHILVLTTLIILVVFLSLGMCGYGFVEYHWQTHGAKMKIYNEL